MLCERQWTSGQAGSCTEALGTWLFNFNMQQGQAERVCKWLDPTTQKKWSMQRQRSCNSKMQWGFGEEGTSWLHIQYLPYFLLWATSNLGRKCSKISKIQELETTKDLAAGPWSQSRKPKKAMDHSLCERLLVCSDAIKNRFQTPGFLVLGREAVRGLILAPQSDGNSE